MTDVKRVLALTNVISPTGVNMSLKDAPEDVRVMVLDIIAGQNNPPYTLTGYVVDRTGKNWVWEY